MAYDLILDLIHQLKVFEAEKGTQPNNLSTFGLWLAQQCSIENTIENQPDEWEGKVNGRSADSVINTNIVHLYRYAKLQAKAAIVGSPFSTPDEFIYLIGLATYGSMTKTALIKLNVHEKSAGIQIINRLIADQFVTQTPAEDDKRNKILEITPLGREVLSQSMEKIRQASRNVTEPLTDKEKLDLIRLLKKLEDFHQEKSGM